MHFSSLSVVVYYNDVSKSDAMLCVVVGCWRVRVGLTWSRVLWSIPVFRFKIGQSTVRFHYPFSEILKLEQMCTKTMSSWALGYRVRAKGRI